MKKMGSIFEDAEKERDELEEKLLKRRFSGKESFSNQSSQINLPRKISQKPVRRVFVSQIFQKSVPKTTPIETCFISCIKKKPSQNSIFPGSKPSSPERRGAKVGGNCSLIFQSPFGVAFRPFSGFVLFCQRQVLFAEVFKYFHPNVFASGFEVQEIHRCLRGF